MSGRTEEEFWSLVDVLGGAANPHTAPELVRALTGEGAVRIEAFADILTEKLQQLESEPLAGILVRDSHHPQDAAPVPLSGDALTNLHFAVVAAGRSRFRDILERPHEVAECTWDFGESDELAVAVSTAYENATGEPWQGLLPGFRMAERGDSIDVAAGNSPWLSLALHGEGDIPAAYFDTAGAVAGMVQDDPTWRMWWSRAEPREMTIEVEYAPRTDRSSFTLRKAQLWASFRRTAHASAA
ncbi:DUF4240 domain-containing protein [Streptomyces sp. SBC-4]|nr:DUF4240 domain-containing protein [Streptomyces sp. SBC-4]MDV5143568.1 DUF4240 domain-containing protein [Streptomyces sp. SBC-4]